MVVEKVFEMAASTAVKKVVKMDFFLAALLVDAEAGKKEI